MIEAIKNFFSLIVDEYLYLTCSIILVLVVIVFLSIVLHSKKKRERAKLKQEEFKQEAVQSLTPEEIDNISNNSANPEEVKQYLTTEVEEVKHQSKSKRAKSPESSKKTTKTAVKETESKPKVETKSEPKKKSQTTTPKKVEVGKDEVKATDKTQSKQTVNKETKPQPKTQETVKTASKKVTKPQPKVEEQANVKSPAKKPTAQTKPETPGKANVATKTTATKTTKVSTVKKVEPTPKKQYTGKWKIVQDDDGYSAILTASNGGTLLQTEKYKSVSNVKNGIETIKKNIDGGNFAISIDKYGHYRFKLFNRSNRLICVSEDYSSKAKCESGIESVKRFAKTASIIQEDK